VILVGLAAVHHGTPQNVLTAQTGRYIQAAGHPRSAVTHLWQHTRPCAVLLPCQSVHIARRTGPSTLLHAPSLLGLAARHAPSVTTCSAPATPGPSPPSVFLHRCASARTPGPSGLFTWALFKHRPASLALAPLCVPPLSATSNLSPDSAQELSPGVCAWPWPRASEMNNDAHSAWGCSPGTFASRTPLSAGVYHPAFGLAWLVAEQQSGTRTGPSHGYSWPLTRNRHPSSFTLSVWPPTAPGIPFWCWPLASRSELAASHARSDGDTRTGQA